MKLRAAGILLCAFAAALVARAVEPADLGQGLSYLRVRSLGEAAPALTAALSGNSAWVIDLRGATTSPDDTAVFGALLTRRPGRASLFILVSPQTPSALGDLLATPPRGVLTLGIEGSVPKPALVVAQPADADRRAYDAADGGMTLESLITGRIEKERYDEASLVREFEDGVIDPRPPPGPDVTGKPADEKAPVLTDRVLQRAVHLHRALAALRPRSR